MKNVWLTEDAVSYFDKTIYASKGDQLKIICDNGTVLIVEDNNGNRFPCTQSIISDKEIKKKEIEKPVIVTTETEVKPVELLPKVKAKKIVPPSPNQSKLF